MEFWEILAWTFALFMGIIAVKITLSFDFNRWLETRRAHQEENLQAICPHCYLSITPGGDLRIDSHFNSPRGTVYWMCNQCGLWILDGSLPERIMKEWARDLEGLMERQRRLNKLARKLGRI